MPSLPKKRTKGSSTAVSNSEQVLPHSKIPHVDMDWALQQSPTVMRLWMESWRADSFGTAPSKVKPQWHTLETKLQGSNLRAAIRTIELAGLFKYDPVHEKTANGQRKIVGWKCTNLHGYYSGYWKTDDDSSKLADTTDKPALEKIELDTHTDKLADDSDDLKNESQTEQDFENSQLLINQFSTPPPSLTNVMEEESVNTPAAMPEQLEAVPSAASGEEAEKFWRNRCRVQVELLKQKKPDSKPSQPPSMRSFIS